MKKIQGKVDIHRHLIGDRKPILMFLGLGAVSSLTGCDTDEAPFYAFTKLSTCEKQLPGQCEAAYKLAEREAKRTALKYMVESECSRDFGRDICLQDDRGAWYPKMIGFITHKEKNVDLTHPFFTTYNHTQSLYRKGFLANSREIKDLSEMDGLNLYLDGSYAEPFPDSELDIESEIIDEAGDYLAKRKRSKGYQQCLKSGKDSCNTYRVTSGTGRIGATNSTYKTTSSLLSQKAKIQNPTYHNSSSKTSKSSGGFGSSGRSFGGFGG